MICSMTGFARAESQQEWGTLAWEIRAVNHRYLDVTLRMPEEFRVLETTLRQLVADRLSRGKVDGNLRFKPSEEAAGEVHLNERLLNQLVAGAQRVADLVDSPAPADPVRLLGWPGVVVAAERDPTQMHESAKALLVTAVQALDRARRREGERIAELLEERAQRLGVLVAALRARAPEIRAGLVEKLAARVAQFGVSVDPARLEQELAMIAQKNDVDEELDRLDSHIVELRHALGREEPVGRRLDFLMQEFNREANTLASKSPDAETTRASVEMKVLIEQMREQIQNVE